MERNMSQNMDPGTGEKTFTQEDVNRIVQERLAKAKSSSEADFTRREQELVQRELHMTAKEVLAEKGLPVQLIDALNCADKETMEKSISVIEKVFNQYKTECIKHNAPVGVSPAKGSSLSGGLSEDAKIRKAMGLRT